jgi:hypothetical protein
MKVKAFAIPNTAPVNLASAIEAWFRDEGFEAQSFEGPEGTYIVQGRKENLLRFIVGVAASLTVTIGTQSDGALTVALGAGSWVDKYLAGIAGILLFAPLAFTAAYGVWRQDQLEDRLWTYIADRLAGAKEVPVLVPTPPFHPVRLS